MFHPQVGVDSVPIFSIVPKATRMFMTKKAIFPHVLVPNKTKLHKCSSIYYEIYLTVVDVPSVVPFFALSALTSHRENKEKKDGGL